jgi:hypothetical protein
MPTPQIGTVAFAVWQGPPLPQFLTVHQATHRMGEQGEIIEAYGSQAPPITVDLLTYSQTTADRDARVQAISALHGTVVECRDCLDQTAYALVRVARPPHARACPVGFGIPVNGTLVRTSWQITCQVELIRQPTPTP